MNLHNYLRKTDNEEYCPAGFVDSRNSSGDIKPGEWRALVQNDEAFFPLQKKHNTRSTNSAKEIRVSLKNYRNGYGAVPWQLKHVRATNIK